MFRQLHNTPSLAFVTLDIWKNPCFYDYFFTTQIKFPCKSSHDVSARTKHMRSCFFCCLSSCELPGNFLSVK